MWFIYKHSEYLVPALPPLVHDPNSINYTKYDNKELPNKDRVT